MYTCKICEESFESIYKFCNHIVNGHNLKTKEYYDRFYKKPEDGICKTCSGSTKFRNVIDGYKSFCSKACISKNPQLRISRGINISKRYPDTIEKRKQTCREKYNHDNPMQSEEIKKKLKQSLLNTHGPDYYINNSKKIRETCKERYGNETYSKTQECKDKVKTTSRLRFGVDAYSQTQECKDKVKATSQIRYGKDNYSQTKEYVEKYRKTCLDKFGYDNPSKDPLIITKIKTSLLGSFYDNILSNLNYIPQFKKDDYIGHMHEYSWKCKKCGTIFNSRFTNNYELHCPSCEPVIRSKPQNIISAYLIKHGLNIETNKRTILDNKFELDIFVPDKNIGIEFNGNYWHSEVIGETPRLYHLNKTKLCESKNIKLIHIFEDELKYKPKIVFSRLKSILGITKYNLYARKCSINIITPQLKNKFLNKYHIQGEDKSQIHLGCFYNKRLIAVMTFSKLRIALGSTHTKGSYELSRYVTISNFNCVGVASKMFSYFIKQYTPNNVISYADRRWSRGNMYYKLGFILKHITKPNYWYLSPTNFMKRLHRFAFRKHVLKKKLYLFDPNISEWKNMQANGYDRIWDCGNYVFEWKAPQKAPLLTK